MRRERVSEDIYIFTSEIYAQVTASVILTGEGAIVIDTLPFPIESREMANFVHRRHKRGARYVINTHFHADHVYGNYLYPEAHIIGHRKCREALLTVGADQLARAQEETPGLEEVKLRVPTIVFDNEMGLHLGNQSLRLIHLPGHSDDGVGVFVDGERILFSGDAVMPVPYFGAGDHTTLRRTLQRVIDLNPENIVQGHGETLLRGEIIETLERHIAYLDCVEEVVATLIEAHGSRAELQNVSIEECGESPIPLDGLVRQLHHANLVKLYNALSAQNA
jgi:glyoxylase-like metal-dependent hydrolase (beta-lactamase superfamily II)